MRLRRYLLAGLIIPAVIVIAYLSFDKIAIFTLSKFYHIDISYKSLTKNHDSGYIFEDLKILNKKMGIGFFSTHAALKPLSKHSILKSLDFDFKFKNVHFVRTRPEEDKLQYNSLESLVAIPFEGKWRYKEISGTVEIFSNGITLKDFSANGREIRLVLSGDLFYNNMVDMDVAIYFSKDVLKDIPPELHSVIMNDEPQDWKSFSVKLKGSLSSPAIQISGKLFRLNFGTITVKE